MQLEIDGLEIQIDRKKTVPLQKKTKIGDTKRMDPSQVIPSGDSNKGKSSEVEVTEGGKEHQQMEQDPIGQKKIVFRFRRTSNPQRRYLRFK